MWVQHWKLRKGLRKIIEYKKIMKMKNNSFLSGFWDKELSIFTFFAVRLISPSFLLRARCFVSYVLRLSSGVCRVTFGEFLTKPFIQSTNFYLSSRLLGKIPSLFSSLDSCTLPRTHFTFQNTLQNPLSESLLATLSRSP